eukprot:UN06898
MITNLKINNMELAFEKEKTSLNYELKTVKEKLKVLESKHQKKVINYECLKKESQLNNRKMLDLKETNKLFETEKNEGEIKIGELERVVDTLKYENNSLKKQVRRLKDNVESKTDNIERLKVDNDIIKNKIKKIGSAKKTDPKVKTLRKQLDWKETSIKI